MTYDGALGVGANWAAIFTAVVAAWGYGSYRRDRCTKRSRLESHLKKEKAKGEDMGQRSVKHLVANLGMSENDVMDAAFRSKHIRCVTIQDDDGFADSLLFEYVVASSC